MKSCTKIVLLCITALLLNGCAAQVDQGKLLRDQEVATSFENGKILPDHTYYYSGPQDEPDAIIGIHNSYTFDRGYWKVADINEDRMRGWNRVIDNHYRIRYRYNGYRITTPEGKQVGIWYGKYSFTVIKFPEPGTVLIYTPDPAPDERRYTFGSPGGGHFN